MRLPKPRPSPPGNSPSAPSRFSPHRTYPEIIGVALFAAAYTAGFLIMRGKRPLQDELYSALFLPLLLGVYGCCNALIPLTIASVLVYRGSRTDNPPRWLRVYAYAILALYWMLLVYAIEYMAEGIRTMKLK
jgi:hypothetical protein